MSPIISQPNALANGTPADGSEVYENIQTAVDLLNGNVDADNVSPTAALPGTVISTTSPIPTNRIADDAVTADKLKDDATGAAGAVTTDHIRSLAVTKAKVAASTLTLAQTDIQRQAVAFTLDAGVAASHSMLAASVSLETSGGTKYVASVMLAEKQSAVDSTTVYTAQTVTPGTDILIASRTVLAVYLSDLTYTAATRVLAGNVVFISVANS